MKHLRSILSWGCDEGPAACFVFVILFACISLAMTTLGRVASGPAAHTSSYTISPPDGDSPFTGLASDQTPTPVIASRAVLGLSLHVEVSHD